MNSFCNRPIFGLRFDTVSIIDKGVDVDINFRLPIMTCRWPSESPLQKKGDGLALPRLQSHDSHSCQT